MTTTTPPIAGSGLVDRLFRTIDRLPGPAEAYFALGAVLLILMVHALLWFEGAYQPGVFDQDVLTAPILIGYFLALSVFMRRTADRAFDDFRPALADPAQEDAERRRLLSIPDRWVLVAGALLMVLTVGLYLVLVRPTIGPRPQLAELTITVLWMLFSVALGLVMAQIVAQLRSIRHLSAVARSIDIFDTGPVDALSRVTALASAGLLVFIAVANLGVPASAQGYVALDVAIIIFASFVFVLPLRVMHERLSKQKAELMAASSRRVRSVLEELHRAIDAGDLSSADVLNKMVTTAFAERDLLSRLQTWPWTSTTLRGFASALLLPVAIFLITRGIDRLI